jgi:hypothetical protein
VNASNHFLERSFSPVSFRGGRISDQFPTSVCT